MRTLANFVRQFALPPVMLVAAFGCSSSSADQTAVEARARALETRANVAAANARVTAADARVKVAEADARLDAQADRRRGNKAGTKGDAKARAKAGIPSGTLLKVSLIDAIDSHTSSPGDRFLASLAESVVINGATVLSRGTKVRGRVIHAERAGKVKGRALIHLELTDILQSSNRKVPIMTSTFEATADSAQIQGKEIHYDPETRLDFALKTSVGL